MALRKRERKRSGQRRQARFLGQGILRRQTTLRLYKIWVEIEQKFFGGDAVRFWLPPPQGGLLLCAVSPTT